MPPDPPFTRDPFDDIASKPDTYPDYKGAKLRLRMYWAASIWADVRHRAQAQHMIQRAEAVLKKYRLGLDVLPAGIPELPRAHIRQGVVSELSRGVGPRITTIAAALPRVVHSTGAAVLDQLIDDVAVSRQGLIQYRGALSIPYRANPTLRDLEVLRSAIGNPPEENRLIVAFVPIDGGASGFATVDFANWVPWAIVDPRTSTAPLTLLHEIGHTCRLAHQEMDAGRGVNVMYPHTTEQSHLWAWQVKELYDSYWCNGSRPKDWWVRKPRPQNTPYMWDKEP